MGSNPTLSAILFSDHTQAGMADSQRLYRVAFYNQGEVYEVYARSVSEGSLFGFVEIEKLVFGERTTVVIDPAEERLADEFSDVERSYIPMQSIIRIDQVSRRGTARIRAADGESNVRTLPLSGRGPDGPGGPGSKQ